MISKDASEQLIELAIASMPKHAHKLLEASRITGIAPVVFVGMSGGVDSAVSAYILLKAGFNVRGCFIKTWQPDIVKCTWKDDRRDAMRVCATLDIQFETINAEQEYKHKVAEYMIREYSIGRTPNPDIMCNKYVKFGVFYNYAIEQGVDFVATGHYAQTRFNEDTNSNNINNCQLIRSVDENKDQTYFLWAINSDVIYHTLFPIGGLTKNEVRQIAKYAQLHVSDKKDSQGVCFIGKIDMKEFIKQSVKTEDGFVLNMKNEIIGTHNGSVLYTIGERHGFRLSNHTPNTAPSFVIRKDIEKNQIHVGTEQELHAFKSNSEIILEQVNYISQNTHSKILQARIRHRQALQTVEINSVIDNQSSEHMKLQIKFKSPQSGIASGQSCVLYDGEVCLGGGIIS